MTTITDENFEAEVLKSAQPVLVDFYAVWCGPCRQLAPVIEELTTELADKVKIVKVDVDEAPKTPDLYNVQSIPTLILFKDGKVIDQKNGFVPKPTLTKWINEKV